MEAAVKRVAGSPPDPALYAPVLARQADSPTMAGIWKTAFGADYPDEAEPFGFVTLDELARMAANLRVGPGEAFVDLGCGRGGPSLWLARETGARVVGLDVVPEAIRNANLRRSTFSAEATFVVASFMATGLKSSSFHGATSVDAFWMAPDKDLALREIARVLVPGSRFVFTTWEPAEYSYRALLAGADFDVVAVESTPNWKARQLSVYSAILQHAKRLEMEMGKEASSILIREAQNVSRNLSRFERLLIVAESQSDPAG
jgi:ubiquinone/menaquinone biosynthesis C-methylase UbiE